MPNLSKVYDSCEMKQTGTLQFAIGYQWTNGLFYIDNVECTWKLFGIIPIASIFDDKSNAVSDSTAAQLEAILEHCIDSKDLVDTVGLSYHNGTHSIDTLNCEWKVIEEVSFGNSLFEKNRNELSQVLNWCNDDSSVKYGFYNYSNETHSIDTSTCEWKKHVHYPNSDSLCVPYVDKLDTGKSWSNKTHYFHADSCTWKVDPDYDAANSKGCPQFCPKDKDAISDDFDKTWGGPGNRHPAFLGWDIPDVCTKDMVKFLKKHSDMFEKDVPYLSPLDQPVSDFGINAEQMIQCENQLLENRNTEPSWPGIEDDN